VRAVRREERLSRARLGLLGLLAAVLVSGSTSAVPAQVQLLEIQHPNFSAQHVAAILQRVNPALLPRQSRRIAAAVIRNSEKYAIDPQLVTAVVLVESGARPWARSARGAIGLMQVMPHMVIPLDVAGNLATIESNVEAGCLILADNIRRLGEEDGISAYFWGSEIRSASYLDRVRQARAAVRRLSES
jgi:soluble lytic murein transglycosylase-like protein